MGGGKRNEEHKAQKRALRRARKAAFKGLPPPPPKPPKVVNTNFFESLLEWKEHPVPEQLETSLPHIEDFITKMWLIAYPCGSNLRKLQRDIAFRMQSKHRPDRKLPYQVIMTIIGKLEREGYLKIKMSGKGHCLIFRDDDCIQFPNPFIIKYNEQMDAAAFVQDESSGVQSSMGNEPFRPKFSKQQEPKVRK
jgi:hypothetical protein